ncbi:MAG: poly-gamma-glutamate synthase PgsB [Candidatus Eisenbacteria sp.]|nr:poly-gamma-glutamate synthase PgsB [Candidatus Eisenbacteria bacterium]
MTCSLLAVAYWRISPFLLLLLVIVIAVYAIEILRHRAMLKRIPIRIHVNGTRGKSSVTRLIAAGLRAGGVPTVAKTTGSAACLIHRDGSEEPVVRRSSPNIREQISIVRQAVAEGAEALVIECMAIRPDLQKVTEKRLVNSTIGVITNVRPDHLEAMGPDLDHVAIALSGTIPRNGKLFAAERRYLDFLRSRTEQRGSAFHLTAPEQIPTSAEMERFNYIEIPDNVGIALDVCEDLGVERAKALEGMYGVTPDIGSTTRTEIVRGEKRLTFINTLAANDPESTVFMWRFLGLHEHGDQQVGVLINNRWDRLRRSVDVARVIAKEVLADWYIVAGDHAATFCGVATRTGVPAEKLISMGDRSPDAVLERIFALTEKHCTVMGIGNIGGFGLRFVTRLEQERKGHDS